MFDIALRMSLLKVLLIILLHSALDRDDRIAKFRFRYLGIVEDVSHSLAHHYIWPTVALERYY